MARSMIQRRQDAERERLEIYDATLLEAARGWTFTAATRNGTPVKFRYQLTVKLEPKGAGTDR